MNKLKNMIEFGMEKAKQFDVVDFAVFKVCLFSLGAIIGAYQAKRIKEFAPFFWITLIFSYVFLIYRIFIDIKKLQNKKAA